MKKTFLSRLFAHSKPAGIACILFIFVYALLLYKKMDMTLFPLNAMFAYERPNSRPLTGYRLWVNDDPADFTKFPYWKKDLMETSLAVYARYHENNQTTFLRSYFDQKKSSWLWAGTWQERLIPDASYIGLWPVWYARKAGLEAPPGTNIRLLRYQLVWASGRPMVSDSIIIYQSVIPR